MDKAALYLRLSKEDIGKAGSGDASESIVNQELILTEYAHDHRMQIVGIYSDDDQSGLYDDRPAFDRLIRDSRQGKFNVVLSKSQARFTRNMEHMEKYLHHDFALRGIRFIGVADGVDTGNSTNKKARQINGLVNEWYCEDLSENIRAVFRQRMRAGQYLGDYAPYGYLKDPEDRYKFVVDGYAADVVRKIYALYLEGYGTRAICSMLEDQEIPSPSVYRREQGPGRGVRYNLWSETTIRRILTNEVYLGKLIQGTTTKASYKDKRVIPVPKDQWYVTEHHHEPIIDEGTFQKVARLRARRRVCREGPNGVRRTHIFAGKLRCASCGHTMIKSGCVRGDTRDSYLRCQLANRSRGKGCTSHTIRYSAVEAAVLARLQEFTQAIAGDKSQMERIMSAVGPSGPADAIQEKKKRIREIERRKDGIVRSMKLLYADRRDEILTYEMFCQLKDGFDRELRSLDGQERGLEEEIRACGAQKSVQELVGQHMGFVELAHDIVSMFVDHIEIGEKEEGQQEIFIHWDL